MKKFRQSLIALLVVGLGMFHVLMIALYLLPNNLLTIHLGTFNREYMHPFLYQNWHLFSPNPGFSQNRLWFRYQLETGDWTPWSDPLDRFQRAHERNRLGGIGRRNRIYRTLVDEVRRAYYEDPEAPTTEIKDNPDDSEEAEATESEEQEHQRRVKQVRDNPVSEVIQRFALDWAKLEDISSSPAAFQYQVMRFYPRRFSNTNKLQRFEKVRKIEFPIIELNSETTLPSNAFISEELPH